MEIMRAPVISTAVHLNGSFPVSTLLCTRDPSSTKVAKYQGLIFALFVQLLHIRYVVFVDGYVLEVKARWPPAFRLAPKVEAELEIYF